MWNVVKAGDHISHLFKECKEYVQRQPITPPPAAAPSAASIIKQLLSESEDGTTISVPTSGKV
jgi:hypothetical protein